VPRKRYPLEAARTLREQEEAAAEQELRERTEAFEAARRSVEHAERVLHSHRQQTEELSRREESRTLEGNRSADVVLRSRDYIARRKREEDGLRRRIEETRRVARDAAEAAEHARQALAEARAARKAVEQHHDRWKAGEDARAEAREEADAEDLVNRRDR